MSPSPITATVPCRACDAQLSAIAETCPHCGVRQFDPKHALASDKRALPAFLLCFFLGCLGVHRFYAGKIGTGVLQLVTFGGLGIWWLVDLIMIATGQFTDDEGKKISMWT
ncbi:MAG TPA: TM2 domain-containing protein [Gemmatimonadaceae bacterium]|nr:TM2 domain-containing protein [Gemmatimonadaceae bacterium]